MSQIIDLGLSYIFMIKNVNNSEKICFSNFYITFKNNQGLYLKFETRFPWKRYEEFGIYLSNINGEIAVQKNNLEIINFCL